MTTNQPDWRKDEAKVYAEYDQLIKLFRPKVFDTDSIRVSQKVGRLNRDIKLMEKYSGLKTNTEKMHYSSYRKKVFDGKKTVIAMLKHNHKLTCTDSETKK